MLLDFQPPVLKPVFLDSGAHSVHTQFWDKLPIDDYIHFVNNNHRKFKIIAAPDVVGNTQETMDNFHYFNKGLSKEVPRSKILSVYHLQAKEIHRFPEVLDYSAKAGLKTIALGGALGVGFSRRQKFLVLEEAYKKLKLMGNIFRVHLFGIADPLSVCIFHPESVDSATYIHKAKYLKYHEYKYPTVAGDHPSFGQTGDSLKDWTREDLVAEAIQKIIQYKDLLKVNGIEIGDEDWVRNELENKPDADRFLAINALSVLEFETYVKDKYGHDFLHYITAIPGYLHKTGLLYDILQMFWRERTLISYSQIWELTSPRRKKVLSVIEDEEVK